MIHSLILRTAARLLTPLILLFSLYLALHGHDQPGGGFSGGLVAALAFALYAFAFGTDHARGALPGRPDKLIAVGLSAMLVAGSIGLWPGDPFLKGLWVEVPLWYDVTLDLGTPMLFDLGVYLVVAGTVLAITFAFEDAFTSLLPTEEPPEAP